MNKRLHKPGMGILRLCFTCITCLLLLACSDNSDKANVFETQVESIDKAREVEDKLLDAADAQRRAIEAGTE